MILMMLKISSQKPSALIDRYLASNLGGLLWLQAKICHHALEGGEGQSDKEHHI